MITASYNYMDDGLGLVDNRTAVHHAAYRGEVNTLYSLIKMGASVNTPNIDGITPLHEACTEGNLECAKMLIQAGAHINARNIDNSTPLCDAASKGSIECVNLLLESGALPNPKLNLSSPLHEAVLRDHTEVAYILVEAGSNLEAMDCHYGTPLHAAGFKGHVGCGQVLLNAGAKVNATKLHETPLHYAAVSQNPEMVILLLNYGANIRATDNQGRRPIQCVNKNTPTEKVLKFYEVNPMLLSQLCRLQIHHSLNRHGSNAVSQLGMPKTLQNYLLDIR